VRAVARVTRPFGDSRRFMVKMAASPCTLTDEMRIDILAKLGKCRREVENIVDRLLCIEKLRLLRRGLYCGLRFVYVAFHVFFSSVLSMQMLPQCCICDTM